MSARPPRSAPRPRPLPALALALLALVPAAALPLAGAGPGAEPLEPGPSVPEAPYLASAVWTGQALLHLGGFRCIPPGGSCGGTDAIVRLDPGADAFVPAGRLPEPLRGMAAAWTGEHVLLFGGRVDWPHPGWGLRASILRYDPATQAVEVLAATLPTPREDLSAAWDGSVAYLVGGYSRDVLRFDPATGTVDAMPVRLPRALGAPGVVWTGEALLVAGGHVSDGYAPGEYPDEVLRVDPVASTVEVFAGRLPTGRKAMGAAWDGTHAYLVGGFLEPRWEPWRTLPTILRVDPAAGEVRTMHALLPEPRYGASAAWDGERVLITSGNVHNGRTDDRLLRYTPALDAPNRAPQPAIAAPASVACEGGHGLVPLGAAGSTDPDGDALALRWSVAGDRSWRSPVEDPGAVATVARLGVGVHTLVLDADDGREARRATRAVEVVDSEPPTVALERPAGGAQVFLLDRAVSIEGEEGSLALAVGHVTLRAAASDACGIAHVAFEASNGQRGVDAQAPYEFLLHPGIAEGGLVTVRVTARDHGGNEATAEVALVQVATKVVDLAAGSPSTARQVHGLCDQARLGDACVALLGAPPAPYY